MQTLSVFRQSFSRSSCTARQNRPGLWRTVARVESFASRLEVLPFDADAARHAGDIRAFLERHGQMIGAYDLLIAGHARSRGLAVVTGNLGEFKRVPGLLCEDWNAAGAAC